MPAADGSQRGNQGETQEKGRPGGRGDQGETQERPRGRGNLGRPRGGPGGTRAREGLHCPEQPSGAGKQQRDDQETKSRTTSQ